MLGAPTPDEFGEQIEPLFGAEAAAPVVGLYQALNAEAANVIEPEGSAQKLLDLTPRTVPEWLSQMKH